LTLLRAYLPVQELFIQGLIKFDDYAELPRDQQLKIRKGILLKANAWLDLFKRGKISLAEYLLTTEIEQNKLTSKYLPFLHLFAAGIITFKNYHALSDDVQQILLYLVPENAHAASIDKLCVYLKTLNANQIIQIKNYLAAIPAEERNALFIQPNLYEKIKNNIADLNRQHDQIVLEFLSQYKSAQFGDPNIIKKERPFQMLVLLWHFNAFDSEAAYALLFKESLINKVIETCEAEANTEHGQEYVRMMANYQYIIENSHQGTLERHIFMKLPLENQQALNFLASAYPEQVNDYKRQALENQYSWHADHAHTLESREFLMYYLNKINKQTRINCISWAVSSLIYPHIDNPELSFLLDIRVLASIHLQTFEAYFKHPIILQALLKPEVIRILDNTQIISLFNHLSDNSNIKTELLSKSREQSLPMSEYSYRGRSRWAELVELMKCCLYTNTLALTGNKLDNLKTLHADAAAMKLLTTSTLMSTNPLVKNILNSFNARTRVDETVLLQLHEAKQLNEQHILRYTY
jgi:hypothetical protein